MNLRPFSPPLALKNPHLQNLLSTSPIRKRLLAKRYAAYLKQEKKLILDGGNGVRLLGYYNRHPQSQNRPLMTLFHGWEGSAHSAYLLSLAGTLYNAGFDTLRLNYRDHGDSHHLNRGIFNSTLVEELVYALQDASLRFDYDRQYLAGFSLGGSFALRVGLRSHMLERPLAGIMAICPVLDPSHTMRALQSNLAIYEQYFVRKWKRSLRKKLEHFPDYNFQEPLKKLRSLSDMNQYFIPRYTEFDSVEAYFDAYTLTGTRLAMLNTPTLVLAAEDDPVIPFSDFNKIARPENLELVQTPHGSHCAYLRNIKMESWIDHAAVEYFGDAEKK